MCKILIIDDKYDQVRTAFEVANLVSFGGHMQIQHELKSDNINWGELCNFSLIFVDLQLANKSSHDGYWILKKIKSDYPHLLNRVALLTGHTKIEEKLKEENLDDCNFPMLIKPISFNDTAKFIKEHMVCETPSQIQKVKLDS